MLISENSFEFGGDSSGVAGGVGDEGGYLEAANENFNITVESTLTGSKITSSTIEGSSAPLTISANPLRFSSGELHIPAELPDLGSAKFLKVTINGISGFIPFWEI